MNTLKINPKEYRTRKELEALFKRKHLKKGDKVEILSPNKDEQGSGFMVLAIIIVLYLVLGKRDLESFEDDIIDMLLEADGINDFEKQIEKEFGLQIEIKHADTFENEDDTWQKIAQQGFLNAYDDDEPDY